MNPILRMFGDRLGCYLSARRHAHTSSAPTPRDRLIRALQPGDVLLVEGDTRISTAIKYLTQSTWSHVALFVGSYGAERLQASDHCFVEADLVEGVRSVGIDAYDGLSTRICRPVALIESERRAITDFVIVRLGYKYDLRNVADLARPIQCAPTARITSGGRFHPESCRLVW